MRKKWVATVLSATALSMLAAGCGDDDDGPAPDTGVIPDSSVDSRVADATVDAQVMVDAAMQSHTGTLVVSEIQVAGAGFHTPSASMNFVTLGGSATGLKYNELGTASPIGNCIGQQFDLTLTPPVAPPASVNVGTVTVTGHKTQGAGCNAVTGPPAQGCASATISCALSGTTGQYDCGTTLPTLAQDFLGEGSVADPATSLTITVPGSTGGNPFMGAARTFNAPGDAVFDTATLTALSARTWTTASDLVAAFTQTGTPTGSLTILRVEATTRAGTATDPFPSPVLQPGTVNKYALITCVKIGATATVPAAAFTATFAGMNPMAYRITGLKAIQAPMIGSLNPITVGAAQGMVFNDFTLP